MIPENGVLELLKRQDQPHRMPIFRNMRQPHFPQPCWVEAGDGLSGYRDRSCRWRADTGESLEKFGLSIAGNASDAHDFSRPNIERNIRDPDDATVILDDEVADFQ